jgi:hypothetical protein
MRNGEQCRCPAQKGSGICRNHADQKARVERRRAEQMEVLCRAALAMTERTGRWHAIQDLFRSRKGIVVALDAIGRALIEGRLDEQGAVEIMSSLEKARFLEPQRTGGDDAGRIGGR